MQAVLVEEVGSWRLADLPPPEPRAGEALVEVRVTGLCRTDLKLIRSGHRDLVLPRVPGEEVVGTVRRLGTPRGHTTCPVGTRVYVYPGTSCGQCGPCRAGAGNLCRSMTIMGFHRDGGFADYVAVPVRSLIPLEDSISDEEAVFAEPLSCCLNALDLSGLSAGEVVGIWGGGPAGTLLARAAASRGAQTIITDPDHTRRALHDGVERISTAVDIAIVAVGSRDAYRQALDLLAPRGRLLVFSGLQPAQERLPVDFNTIHYLEQTVVGAYGCTFEHGVEAVRLLTSREIRVDDLVTHRFPFEDLDAALSIVEQRAGMKVHLYPTRHDPVQDPAQNGAAHAFSRI